MNEHTSDGEGQFLELDAGPQRDVEVTMTSGEGYRTVTISGSHETPVETLIALVRACASVLTPL